MKPESIGTLQSGHTGDGCDTVPPLRCTCTTASSASIATLYDQRVKATSLAIGRRAGVRSYARMIVVEGSAGNAVEDDR